MKNSNGKFFRIDTKSSLKTVAKKLTRHVKKLGTFKQLKADIKAGVSAKQNLVFTFLPSAEDYKNDFEKNGTGYEYSKKYEFYEEDRRLDVDAGRKNFEKLAGQKDDLSSAK